MTSTREKAKFQKRCESQGIWQEFIKEREALKATGVSGADAWAQLMPKFTERLGPDEEEDVVAFEELASRSHSVDFNRDFEWAYANIGNKRARQSEAPSTAAWWVLQQGRKLGTKFLDGAKTYFKTSNSGESKVFRDDKRRKIDVIEAIQESEERGNCHNCGAEQ